MKKYIYTMLAGAALMFNACNLDEYDPNSLSGDEKLGEFETYQGLVNQCYSPLGAYLFKSSDYVMLAEGGTDIWGEPKNGNNHKDFHKYTGIDVTKSYYKAVWNNCYNMINLCNAVCDRAEIIEGASVTDIEQCVAQARCLRAYYYSILVEQFGNVTLELKESLTPNTAPERSSIEAIYAVIVSDLKYAVEKLPKEWTNYGRVTKKTALGLLCRVYIQGAAYNLQDDGVSYLQKAYDTSTDFIKNKDLYGAALWDDFADVFNEDNARGNKEYLFVAAYGNTASDAMTTDWATTEVYRYFMPNFGDYSDLGLYNKNNNTYVYGRTNDAKFLPSRYLLECFAQDETDTRFRYSFISAYAFYSGKNSLSNTTTNTYQEAHDKLIATSGADYTAKWGIASKWNGWCLYPHFYHKGSGELEVWNADGTVATAPSEGNILHPELPLAKGVEGQTYQYVAYASLKTLTPEEKAEYPCFVVNAMDLYETDGTPKEKTNYAGDPASTRELNIFPALSKFNMPGKEYMGFNSQTKTADVPIMRFAEVYLIAAEASVRLGKTDAKTYIDVLRNRAHAALAPSTINMDYIFDEYARELCGEFGRWNLLKRNKAFETRLGLYNKPAAANFVPTNYLRPIPKSFFDTIDNAAEYGQNDGY